MLNNQNIAARVIESGGKLSVKSALNPMLWLCAIITVPSLIAIPFFNEDPLWLILLIICPVFATIFGFFFLLLFDRDKLQSEEFQLKKKSMELIQEKGDLEPKILDSKQLDVVENPECIESSELNEG